MQFLYDVLQKGKSPFHGVELSKKYLEEHGFEACDYTKELALKPGGKYYVQPYPSMLLAFYIGEHCLQQESGVTGEPKIKLAMAHTDFPCFKLKSQPEYVTKKYLMANVEPYGGMIKATWLDRPLGLAGKVVLASEQIYQPKVVLFDSEKPLFVIPSLAPHLDREEKKDLDMQTQMQPIAGMLQEQCNKDGFLQEYLASQLQVTPEEILAYDLYLYNAQELTKVGLDQEFMLSPRIDNLASVAALIEGIAGCENKTGISMVACYDNEEIGSRSKQGADSNLMVQFLERIGEGLGVAKGQWQQWMTRGFLLSVDGAHGIHPNYVSKSDITNDVYLGEGVVIKTSASQRYLSDAEGVAAMVQLCKSKGISYQVQVNRSGMPGGQTLGPIVASYLPWQGADLGVPMLAMHSANEMATEKDWMELRKLLQEFLG